LHLASRICHYQIDEVIHAGQPLARPRNDGHGAHKARVPQILSRFGHLRIACRQALHDVAIVDAECRRPFGTFASNVYDQSSFDTRPAHEVLGGRRFAASERWAQQNQREQNRQSCNS
jgi:hypothetical protein